MTSTTEFPKFLKWSNYPSKDEKKPDVIKIKMTSELFDTKFQPCIRGIIDREEKTIPIGYKALLLLIQDALRDGKIYIGKDFKIITHLGISKFHAERTPRRFRLEY